MKPGRLETNNAIQILKSVNEVFEAIVNPEMMANYFIAKGSGRMEEGKTLLWSFPEFEGEFPVKVGTVIKDTQVNFYWGEEGQERLVTITLSAYKETYSVVRITEKGMENTTEGIEWLKGNTEGWANFLACLKAWLEYGIHLRKGAFDFRFDPK